MAAFGAKNVHSAIMPFALHSWHSFGLTFRPSTRSWKFYENLRHFIGRIDGKSKSDIKIWFCLVCWQQNQWGWRFMDDELRPWLLTSISNKNHGEFCTKKTTWPIGNLPWRGILKVDIKIGVIFSLGFLAVKSQLKSFMGVSTHTKFLESVFISATAISVN